MKRISRAVKVRNIQIGGGAPVSVQSMTKTDTTDVDGTLRQIEEMTAAGCEIVRIAVPDDEAAAAMYEIRNYVDDGGLVSYGPSLEEMNRRAAGYVDRIFRGAKAGSLAIEQPSTYEMVINLRTAKTLGLTIPQSVRIRADEVIQ